MGFEDERGDFFSGREGPRHDKRCLLADLVRFGALATSGFGGREVPYWGATEHLYELRDDGFAVLCPEQPIEDAVIWIPTEAGCRAARAGKDSRTS